ncbi:MAG TPA: aminotransferase class IV [Terriglobia bacterium]|nr:aminotransferase class IV [Terriglobia bacterium]
MDPLIVHNQKIVKLAEANLSPGQSGLMLGWGVFTTLRLYRGAPFEFARHWQRMARDATRLNVPLSFEQTAIHRLIIELACANGREDGMARVIFVRNSGGQWASGVGGPDIDLLIFTRELPAWPASYRLQIQPNAIFAAGTFAGAKMLSWAGNSTLMEKARAEGYDEALLLNERGEVAECTSANIFMVHSGKALTPPLASGCLPGVTREIFLEIGPAAGIPVSEQPLTLESLDQAEEVFISSTTREVGAVRSIGERWQFKAPGSVTKALAEAFRSYVQRNTRVQVSSGS